MQSTKASSKVSAPPPQTERSCSSFMLKGCAVPSCRKGRLPFGVDQKHRTRSRPMSYAEVSIARRCAR
jgi:hypothetical protein